MCLALVARAALPSASVVDAKGPCPCTDRIGPCRGRAPSVSSPLRPLASYLCMVDTLCGIFSYLCGHLPACAEQAGENRFDEKSIRAEGVSWKRTRSRVLSFRPASASSPSWPKQAAGIDAKEEEPGLKPRLLLFCVQLSLTVAIATSLETALF